MASANKELREKGLGERAFSGRLGIERGSALILVVVLTSLLAIVGVMFLMVSRMDRMATSGISEDKQLDLAVDTVVGKICGQLVWDVPGTNLASGGRPEYHDYPGPEDPWLAASEPNNAKTWPQISDVTGYIARMGWPTRNIPIEVVPDHEIIDIGTGYRADADGDGVADAKWFMLEGVTSSRGEPIYAAVRVTDNGGKINVNTAFVFDPGNPDVRAIDGASLWQINLMALANRPYAPLTPAGAAADERALLWARANNGVNLDPCDLTMYEDQVTWRYAELTMPYTPFDISDELDLRNRFLLNMKEGRDVDTRVEHIGWARSFLDNGRGGTTLEVPIGQGGSNKTVDDWFDHAALSNDPNLWRFYDYRHLATTYSIDRIINPLGFSLNYGKMGNINTTDVFTLMRVIKSAIYDANPTMVPLDVERIAGQVAANIKDFRDEGSDVTVVWEDPPIGSGTRYYGYERPCIYISQVAATSDSNGNNISYAVELYKPYAEDNPPVDPDPNDPARDSGWRLVVDSGGVTDTVDIHWVARGAGNFHVIIFKGPARSSLAGTVDTNESDIQYSTDVDTIDSIRGGGVIYLQRYAPLTFPKRYIRVDSHTLRSAWFSLDGVARSLRRDISRHKCIRQLWEGSTSTSVTLGRANGYVDPDPAIVQAHPYLDPNVYTDRYTGGVGFKNVGEIGMVFDVNAYNVPVGSKETDLRLDVSKSLYARIFNYLTVFDPFDHGHTWEETRVKGRININTAPPFVIEQLPWVTDKLAQAIVGYRDKLRVYRDVLSGVDVVNYSRGRAIAMWDLADPLPPPISVREELGFANVGELLNVTHGLTDRRMPSSAPVPYDWRYDLRRYGRDKDPNGFDADQIGFPDLTGSDGAANDFEERDVIFSRISNLVTVRSDVFTAYILVRIGTDGPQRRVVAILDRSGVEPNNPNTKVKVRALHRMADAW